MICKICRQDVQFDIEHPLEDIRITMFPLENLRIQLQQFKESKSYEEAPELLKKQTDDILNDPVMVARQMFRTVKCPNCGSERRLQTPLELAINVPYPNSLEEAEKINRTKGEQ